MKREDIAAMYENDPESFYITPADFDREDFESYEVLALENYNSTLDEIQQHLNELEQYADEDKEVRYVLDVIENEGLWYAVLHKFDIDAHIWYGGHLPMLCTLLKAYDKILSNLAE